VRRHWQTRLGSAGLFLWGCGVTLFAQVDTHRFEQSAPLAVPAPVTEAAPVETDPAVEEAVQDKALRQLSGKELRDHPRLMAQVIEQLIKQRQWALLPAMLADYEGHQEADPHLVLYAKGALYRQQKNYPLATGAFQALLDLKPELTYVRLDLAMMQVEDKRYGDAIRTLAQLAQHAQTPAPIKQMAQNHLAQLRKLYAVEFTVSGNFTRNDNVNQASAERTIEFAGLEFVKNPESLPKTGHGFMYGLGVRKMLPLAGNHGLSAGLRYSGIHYWDQQDYSESTLRLNPAYHYQTHNQWFRAGPVYEKNWLGGSQYGSRVGAQAEWGRQILPKHYLIPHAEYTHKRYDSPALNRYEGDSYRAGLMWVHQLKPGTAISAGGSYQQDVLNEKAESSKTLALRLGGSYRTKGGWSTQVSLHVGERNFDAMHPLFGMTRRDKELIGSVGIWHRKLRVMKITPKLVYRFSDIRSNIPALYSRQSGGWMVEVADVVF